MTLEEAMDRFVDLLQIQFMAPRTKKNYESYVRKFLDSCSWANDTDDIQLSHFQDFIIALSHDYASSTVGCAVSAVRTFAEAVLDRRYTKRQIPKPKTDRLPAAFFTEEQVCALLSDCRDPRLKAWITLGFDCGLRVSEVSRLEWQDIDKSNHTITVRNSKRDKSRIVPYSPFAREVLNHYCEFYNVSPSSTRFIFPGKKEDKPISPSTISSHFKKYSRNFPFTSERHHFHSLRHSYAVAMLAKIMNPYQLAELMGHSSIQTTMNYVHMSAAHKKDFGSPCNGWNVNR